jgi:outer membrane lipoprotein-sorting protein
VRLGVASALAIVTLVTAAASGQAPKNDPQAAEQLRAAYGRFGGLKSYRMQMKMVPGAQTGGNSMDNLAMVMEVVPPDRLRTTAESDEFGMETISVAGEVRYRLTKMKEQAAPPGAGMSIFSFLSMALSFALNPAGAAINAASMAGSSTMGPATGMPPIGVWQCPLKTGGGGPQAPAGNAGEETAVVRLDDAAVDGAATQVFLATQPGQRQGPSPGNKTRIYVLKDGGLPRRIEVLDASDKPTMIADYRDYDAPIAIQLPQCGQKT